MPTRYLPPFSCFRPRTLSQASPQYSETQGIYMMLFSLRSNRQSLSRQQGIILIKTANAVILPIMDKKMDFFGKTGIFESNTQVGKRPEWHATVYNGRFGKIAALAPQKRQCELGSYYPAGSLVKPPPRKAATTLYAMVESASG